MMWRTVAIVLMCAVATPAFAARVYLKEGGYIEARKVWRTPGKVHVLVNRDILTEFSAGEIDLKRTFAAGKRKAVRKKPAGAVQPPAAAANGAGAAATTGSRLPSLPEKAPSTAAGEPGTIGQHKKGMAERANE